jgi:hypothetical protein
MKAGPEKPVSTDNSSICFILHPSSLGRVLVTGALWLLIGFQMRGWVRYLGRNLRTVKGALLAVVGATVILFWLLSLLLTPTEARGAMDPSGVRRYGPLALLGYCLLNVIFSTGERSIYFAPAEINFLFPGPFSRRQLLAYKVTLTLLVGLPTALFMCLMVRVRDGWFPAVFTGLLLLYAFMQLFTLILGLLTSVLGARLYTQARRLVLAGAVLAAGLLALHAGGPPTQWRLRELLERTLDAPTYRTLAAPLSWFFEALLAQQVWPDLGQSALLALLVDLALVGAVFALDAQYLEASATSSARLYARLQRLRGRNVDGGESASRRPVRTGLPMLPWWGGIGPILWRQLTSAVRGMGRVLVVMVILVAIMAGPLLAGAVEDEGALLGVVTVAVGWVTVFLTALVPFDFRGDIDRLATLKTLPLPAWRLAVGQLLTPVLLLTLLQWLALAGLLAFAQKHRAALLMCAVYAPAFNFLLFALENLLFLLFPVRLMASTPGDFQALGRNVLLAFGKMIGLGITAGVAIGVFFVAYFLSDRNPWAGVAASWPVVALAGAALVPLIALAFQAFDVGRDTPA